MKAKQPFLPLFFGDFLGATAEWEGEARALYLLLLGYQWSLGSLPAEPRRICKLIGWSEALFFEHWPIVRCKFAPASIQNSTTGEIENRLVNERLESHRERSAELSRKNSASGSLGAQARWAKNGERHTQTMASATHNYGDSHKNANSVTNSNPSHPIPSYLPRGVEPPSEVLELVASDSNPPPRKAISKTPRKPLKTRLPADFALTPQREAYARTNLPGVEPAKLFENFCDMARAKGWEYVDWNAHWQTLVRQWRPDSGHWSAGQYPRAAAPTSAPPTPADDPVERHRRQSAAIGADVWPPPGLVSR